jgi:hypothetical protein
MCFGAGDSRNSLIPGRLGGSAAQLDRCAVYALLCGFPEKVIYYEWVSLCCTVAQSKKRDFGSACYPRSQKRDLHPTDEDLSVETPDRGTRRA